jgi:uncharacterized integral membrane protein
MDNVEGNGRGPVRDRKRDTRLVLIGVVVVLLVWFALANTERVEVHFWVTSAHAPVVVVVVIAGLFGGAIGWFACRRWRRGRV